VETHAQPHSRKIQKISLSELNQLSETLTDRVKKPSALYVGEAEDNEHTDQETTHTNMVEDDKKKVTLPHTKEEEAAAAPVEATQHTTGTDSMRYCGDDDVVKKELKRQETDFDLDKYPVREFVWRPRCFGETLAFNPFVSLFGVVVLWGIAIWSMGK